MYILGRSDATPLDTTPVKVIFAGGIQWSIDVRH